MQGRTITESKIQEFYHYLLREEKSQATLEKYLRDVRAFSAYVGQKWITKEVTIHYKRYLQERGYAPRSINSMLASVNGFFSFANWLDCKVKTLKLQKQVYCNEEQELTKAEYSRLLAAAETKPQLRLVMQTICATGIRVSELRFFTVEAVQSGEVTVTCKGKTRTILIPGKLRSLLKAYTKAQKIRSGVIFRERRWTAKPFGPRRRACAWRRESNPARYSPTTGASCLPEPSMAWKRTLPSWRISWATAASTPPASISSPPAQSTGRRLRNWAWSCNKKSDIIHIMSESRYRKTT